MKTSKGNTRKTAVMRLVSPNDEPVGEIELVEKKYRCRLREGFFLTMEDTLQIVATLNLSNTEYRVLLALLANLDYGNFIRKKQSIIASKTNIKPSNFSKALQKLKALGLVFVEDTDEGRLLRVSSALAWKGHANREFEAIYHKDSTRLSNEIQMLK